MTMLPQPIIADTPKMTPNRSRKNLPVSRDDKVRFCLGTYIVAPGKATFRLLVCLALFSAAVVPSTTAVAAAGNGDLWQEEDHRGMVAQPNHDSRSLGRNLEDVDDVFDDDLGFAVVDDDLDWIQTITDNENNNQPPPTGDNGNFVGFGGEDGNGQIDNIGSRNNSLPCSICGGLSLLSEKIPFPDTAPGRTCAEADRIYTANQNCSRADPEFVDAFEECCRPSIPVYRCEANVHESLFGTDGAYNPAVPPITGMDPEERLRVDFKLVYQAIEAIDEEKGTAQMYVEIHLEWIDPRLTWNLDSSSTCASMINVYAGYDPEVTTIWVPDFDLGNQIEGIQSMRSSQAIVYADGTVVWKMIGGLDAFCAFRGLADIPFDTLGCQLLFLPFSREMSKLIEYRLLNPDFIEFGVFEDAYNEWHVIPELVEQGYTVDGNYIYYNLYFRRATKHYQRTIVYPTAILTYLSFLTFLLDMREGERMGFATALALVVVAQQIITSSMLPISEQNLWLDQFVAYSFYWVVFTVVQSVVVGLLYYVKGDLKVQQQQEIEADREELRPLSAAADETESGNPQSVTDNGSSLNADENNNKNESIAKRNCPNRILFAIPLRKFDILCFVIGVTTYTAFLLWMNISRDRGSWLVDEPVWFDSEVTDMTQRVPAN